MISEIRDALQRLSLPTIWATWAETVKVDVRYNWSDPHTVYRPEPPEPTVEEWDEDCDGEAFCIDRKRTPEEMAAAVADYEREIEKWTSEHGDAKFALSRHRLGPDTFEAVVSGNGRRVSLVADGERGPWRAMCCSGLGWHDVADAVREAKESP